MNFLDPHQTGIAIPVCPEAVTEPLNGYVRDHEVSVSSWAFRNYAARLHELYALFNAAFFSDTLPAAFLRFGPCRKSSLGQYLPDRNGCGARFQITLNSLYVDMPLLTAAMLLHGMAHIWQDITSRPGKNAYHNKELMNRCQALGIPFPEGRGCRVDLERLSDPFLAIVASQGIEALPSASLLLAKSRSRWQVWQCQCSQVRSKTEIQAICQQCGTIFQQENAFVEQTTKPGLDELAQNLSIPGDFVVCSTKSE